MKRYARITRKIPREIVLLRSLPCVWGRCTFCDYIGDNTTDQVEIQRVADEELAKVTGEFGRLEVIDSASILELPELVRAQIRDLIAARGIAEFICESHWGYRDRFDETRAFFGVPTRIKVGVETFDHRLRNEVLGKGMYFDRPEEVARHTETICLLVGFRGQTRTTIRRDIDILLKHFEYGCVNLLTRNTRSADLMDPDLQSWFAETYAHLDDHPTIEVLWENTDFGIG
jgi:hypothetical protein